MINKKGAFMIEYFLIIALIILLVIAISQDINSKQKKGSTFDTTVNSEQELGNNTKNTNVSKITQETTDYKKQEQEQMSYFKKDVNKKIIFIVLGFYIPCFIIFIMYRKKTKINKFVLSNYYKEVR